MSVATSMGGNEGMSTQPSCDESPINVEKDVDEVAPDPNVQPIGRKVAKEAHRKGKAAKEESPIATVVMTLANSQASILSAREKRDKAYARQMQDQQQREYRRLQMDMRNSNSKSKRGKSVSWR
ncbi:hypothetical protein ACLB2K_041795 [Fragaria x ananassa]